MDVKGIIEGHLRINGYDGLFNEGECACELSDLMPCCAGIESIRDCHPGYKSPCDGNCEYGYGCSWHIGRDKPAPVKSEA